MGFQGLNSASQPNEWKGVYDKMRPLKFRGWDKEKKQWTSPCSGSQGKVELMIFDTPGIEVTQFTGLLDCHGKEIWEGDIVKFDNQWWSHNEKECEIRKIEFDYGTFSYFNSGERSVGNEEMEVIGNIYENPELLE